jgi:hypothetical protein
MERQWLLWESMVTMEVMVAMESQRAILVMGAIESKWLHGKALGAVERHWLLKGFLVAM